MNFVYQPLPTRMVFGRGTLAQVGEEIVKLDKCKALVITTSGWSKQGQHVADIITGTTGANGPLKAIVFSGAVMHTPVMVTEEAIKLVEKEAIDCLIAIGGGSSIGLSKAISYRTDLCQIVIPTTYAGSEATPILGQTDGKVKKTIKNAKVQPGVIIYDVNLTHTLSKSLIVTSGINAIARAVEALYSPDSSPIISSFAIEGIKAMMKAIPLLTTTTPDESLRKLAQEKALYAAWLCGSCLGNVGMALHHKLCHTLGGTLNTPHAQTHTVILPHALHYNYGSLSSSVQNDLRLAFEVEGDDRNGTVLAAKIYDLSKQCHGPSSLRELGVKESDLDMVVQQTIATPYWNPAPLEENRLRKLLQRAWQGQRPSAAL